MVKLGALTIHGDELMLPVFFVLFVSFVPFALAVGAVVFTTLVVGVDRDGKLYLEGKEIASAALAKALVDHALKSPGTEVVIVADERSLTGAAVGALDAAAKAGLKPRLQTRQPR